MIACLIASGAVNTYGRLIAIARVLHLRRDLRHTGVKRPLLVTRELEVVCHRLVGDVFADPTSGFASRAEVNAAPGAGKTYFDGGVGEALIRRRYARQSRRT